MAFAFDFAGRTDPGRMREINEDAFGADPDAHLFVVADGLGGYNAGEVASALAVSALLADLPGEYAAARQAGAEADPAVLLRAAIERVNRDIRRASLNSVSYQGMATTLVLAWAIDEALWLAHAGDSRAYRLRDGELTALTRDHSFMQELLDAGMLDEQEARQMPARNLVTRALGVDLAVEADIRTEDLRAGDVLLLCSDGLTRELEPEQIAATLIAGSSAAAAVEELIEMANAAGGADNTTVVVVRVGPAAAE